MTAKTPQGVEQNPAYRLQRYVFFSLGYVNPPPRSLPPPQTLMFKHLRICLFFALAFSSALAQPASAESPAMRAQRMSRDAESRGLAEAFRGITADGRVEKNLFPLRSTGVSTAPVRIAAQTFLQGLNADQRKRTVFPVDDAEWRKWMNQHFYVRQGVSFLEMSPAQRESAFTLLRASLSARGLQLSQDIMKLNHTLGELNNNNFTEYGEWLYHVTIMGEPSADKPWGWQLDGHHLIINYFVLGDQVVMSPVFVGSEPVVAPSGRYQGVAILQAEQRAGLDLLRSLDPTQRQQAVLNANKTGNNNLTEAFKDNVVLAYEGIPAAHLSAAQKSNLLALVNHFIANQSAGHAQIKMEEVRAHLERTYFAWVGGHADDSVFYFRIHSPVVLIEFDHQRPANLKHLAANPQLPNREHIHVVIRTPNGNDYGKDLLSQHLTQHPH
ncbi:MAG: hypothetical protein RL077_2939 [Verrucomicrobiota bacterium]